MLLHRKPLSHLILKIMKNLISSIAFITLFCSLTSCTAEDIQAENTIQNQISISAKDGVIDPPPPIKGNTPPPVYP